MRQATTACRVTLTIMSDMSHPEHLQLARLHCRRIRSDDLVRVFEIYGDPQTNTFNPAGPFRDLAQADATLQRWLAQWEQYGFGHWAVSAREAPDDVLGFGGLSYSPHFGPQPEINLGYRFAPMAWGHGYATEFARGLVEFGLHTIRLPRIYAKVREPHRASRRVLEKAGLRQCGVLDDVPGAPLSVVYRISRPDSMNTPLAPTLSVYRAQDTDRPALQRMLELYQYELSDIWDQDLDAQGEYGYALDRFWQDGPCIALLATVGGHHAGFALVDESVKLGPAGRWMDQFFVMKKYRRAGIGRQLATHAFDLLPGIWEVGQMTDNHGARAFWRRVIDTYCGGRYVEQTLTEGWWQGTIQRFDTAHAALAGKPG